MILLEEILEEISKLKIYLNSDRKEKIFYFEKKINLLIYTHKKIEKKIFKEDIFKIEKKFDYGILFSFSSSFLKKIFSDLFSPHFKKVSSEFHLVEHTSCNPTGRIHVGEFRGSILGNFFCNLLDFFQIPRKNYFYVNDIGKQLEIFSTFLKNKNIVIEKENLSTLESLYSLANNEYLEKINFKKEIDEKVSNEVRNRKISESKKKLISFWLEKIFFSLKERNILFDEIHYESEYVFSFNFQEILNLYFKKDLSYSFETGIYSSSNSKFFIIDRKKLIPTYVFRDFLHFYKVIKNSLKIILFLGEDHYFHFLNLKHLLEKFLNFKNLNLVKFNFVLNSKGNSFSARKNITFTLDSFHNQLKKKFLKFKKEDIFFLEKIILLKTNRFKKILLNTENLTSEIQIINFFKNLKKKISHKKETENEKIFFILLKLRYFLFGNQFHGFIEILKFIVLNFQSSLSLEEFNFLNEIKKLL